MSLTVDTQVKETRQANSRLLHLSQRAFLSSSASVSGSRTKPLDLSFCGLWVIDSSSTRYWGVGSIEAAMVVGEYEISLA